MNLAALPETVTLHLDWDFLFVSVAFLAGYGLRSFYEWADRHYKKKSDGSSTPDDPKGGMS